MPLSSGTRWLCEGTGVASALWGARAPQGSVSPQPHCPEQLMPTTGCGSLWTPSQVQSPAAGLGRERVTPSPRASVRAGRRDLGGSPLDGSVPIMISEPPSQEATEASKETAPLSRGRCLRPGPQAPAPGPVVW